jgi:tRNA(Ile)-lysidine synthase
MAERVLQAAHDSGLVRAGEPLLVMLSGGADSVALLDVAVRLDAEVSALHVNYGLREEAAADEAHCRGLCAGYGVGLVVKAVKLDGGAGNLQALARDARYALAEHHASGDYAAAHTASDQAETVLYRLSTSPGRRALLGMEPRRGRLVRPLLGVTREEVRDYCRDRSLEWREDASNADPRLARARVRHELLPALRSLDPRAERAIAETALTLRDEAEVLDAAAAEALTGMGGGPVVELTALAELPRGLARIVLRVLAEEAMGDLRSLSRSEVDAVLALGQGGGTKSLDLGDSLTAVAEYGTLRFRRGGPEETHAPDPVPLAVPGAARFGTWQVQALPGSPGEVRVSVEAIGGGPLTIRGWRDGDRMRPVGLGGTKTLQDLFTDRKVPRALRRSLPIVETRGAIVWVAGVAVDERFAAPEGDLAAVGLSARHLDSRP